VTSPTSYGLIAQGVAVGPDNKTVIVGYTITTQSPDFGIIRLNEDGTLDTSFGLNGAVSTAFGSGSDIARCVAIQSDGKILVGGYSDLGRNSGDTDFCVVRYNANGTLDTSFGDQGKVSIAIGNPLWGGDYAYKIGVTEDNKIVLTGSCSTLTGSNTKSRDFAAIRLLSSGKLDTSFSLDGIATATVGNSDDQGVGQYIYKDGKILVGGWSESFINGNSVYDYSIVRFNADGTLDNSFGANGKIPSQLGSNQGHGWSLTVQSDGKILQAGDNYNVIRYNSDGSLDLTFGSNGTSSVISQIGYAANITALQDGKILVAGSIASDGWASFGDFYITRLNSDGSIDTSFNDTGSIQVDFDGGRDYLFDLAVRSDGVIVATGFTEKNSKDDLAVVLIGNDIDNSLKGTLRIDKIYGDGGEDFITGGGGSDYIDGGEGEDTANYSDQTTSVVIDLSSGAATTVVINGKNDDTLISIENLTGGSARDTLTGRNDSPSILNGGGGNDALKGGNYNDELIGGAGNDILDGGEGFDCAEYEDSKSNLTINLQTGTALGTDIGSDTLRNIEEACGGSGNDVITGLLNLASQLEGGLGDDTLNGGNQDDVLIGGDGKDTLNGGLGGDSMTGGKGDDIYVVDDVKDVVVEVSGVGSGVDTVRSFITHSLGDNVENLVLLGTKNIDGIGNSLVNTITGNDGINIIDGGAGADVMAGGKGDDTYFVDNVGDKIVELSGTGSGTDTVQSFVTYALSANTENLILTGISVINGTGNDLNNTITGNMTSNQIDGGTGADTMIGGGGDDIYIVDNLNDRITELSDVGSGVDLVRSLVSYVLGQNIENLTLTGTTAINGTGNDQSNTLIGNDGNNVLDGKAGSDTMIGGKGNDTYYVDTNSDLITELADQGTDLVNSTATSYTLVANVENLTLQGSNNIDGTGNDLANILTGNTGNNLLQGLDGNDTIYGGLGDDNIIGGKGNDNLFGDDGVDVLTGIAVGMYSEVSSLGRGTIDKLTGGKQADTFVLGNADGVFYNDGNSGSAGTADYAWITDFKASERDKIQLAGQDTDYFLRKLTVGSTTGMGIYLNNSQGSGTSLFGWDSKDELVGFIQGYTNTNIIGSNDFKFIPPV